MHTSWKNWALTLGSAIVATLISTGHTGLVTDVVDQAAHVVLLIIAPLGPQ